MDELIDPNDEHVSKTIDSGTEPPHLPESPLFIKLSPFPSKHSKPIPDPSDNPLLIIIVLFNASLNQDSDFGSSNNDPTDSGRVGKRNNLIRDGVGELTIRSCSSNMLCRSSSVVIEIKESRSSLGSWYLSVNGRLLYRVRERWWVSDEMVAAVVRRSTATMRVSPPA